jgi:molybdenum cofactor synthesis domain-containing protein
MPVPTAAIVVIGDEILSGKFPEDNAAWLLKELRELGVALRHIQVIPDVVDEIRDAVRADAARFDHVFTSSGGVGPTHDDVTIVGIARAFDVGVVRHPELEAQLRAYYGAAVLEAHLRMAEVPEGARLIAADHPSWPVTSMRNVYVLPGVPAIFRKKFSAIRERFRVQPFHVRRVYLMSDEGAIAADLDAVVAAFPGVSVGSYPRFEAADFRVIVTLEAKDAPLVDAAARELSERLGAKVVRRE